MGMSSGGMELGRGRKKSSEEAWITTPPGRHGRAHT